MAGNESVWDQAADMLRHQESLGSTVAAVAADLKAISTVQTWQGTKLDKALALLTELLVKVDSLEAGLVQLAADVQEIKKCVCPGPVEGIFIKPGEPTTHSP